MEGSHFAISSPAQQEDSWTCQRCGWVYPNAHPSAKHRRNHKKHCGKVKGFDLQSEVHKGGSSDEASSDDSNHVNKESLPLQSQHDSIGPVEVGNMVHVVEPPSALQSRELLPPETNDSNNIIKLAAPADIISDSIELKPEVPAHESTCLTDIVKAESSADEHVPNIDLGDETSKTLGDGKDLISKDIAGNPTEIAASDIPEGQNSVGLVSGLQGVDAAAPGQFSNQIKGRVEGGSMLQNAAFNHAGSTAVSDEPSKTIEGGGVPLPSCSVEAAKFDQSKNTEKRELTTTPDEHSIDRQGSSPEEDSWTCRRCGWVYPNPHPSAKHRRNHKKHCGKLKGFELLTEPHKGGSSDEVSSDEEKKGHIQHESSPIIQGEKSAGGLTLTGATTSSEDQFRDLCASKESPSAGGLQYVSDFRTVKTGTESSDIDSRDAVFPAEENLEGQQQGEGAAAGDHTPKVPHDSNGPEVLQRKEEISSSQAIAPQTQSSTISSFAVSEGLGNLVKDSSSDVGSTSKVSDAPPELTGDFNPNFENSSMLNILPSDDFSPADVGSGKAEVNEIGAVVMPITHPRNSGLVNESLEPFRGTGSHKEVHANETTDEAEKLDLFKPSSFAGEMPDNEFSSNLQPVLVAGNTPGEEAESLSAEGSSVQTIGLPSGALSTAVITGLADDSEREKFVDMQATFDPVERLAKEEVSGHTFGGQEDTPFEKVETPQETEMLVRSLDGGTSVGKTISEMRTIPDDISGETASINDTPTAMAFSDSKVIPESMPLVSVEGTPAPCSKDEGLGQTDVGLDKTSTSSMDTVVTEMPTQSLENPGVDILEERPIACTTGELLSSDDRPTSTTFESIESMSDANPERGPPVLEGEIQEDILPASSKDKVLGQTDGGLEEKSTSSNDNVVERPQLTAMPTQLLDNSGVDVSEERPIAHTPEELLPIDDRPTSTTIHTKAEAIPERGPPALVGETQADTLATSSKDEVSGQKDRGPEETSTSTVDKVVEMPTQLLDNPVAHTTGELLPSYDRPSSTTIESKAEAIPEGGPPAFVGGAEATSAEGEVSGQTDGAPEETSNSTLDRVVQRPKMTEMSRQALDNPGIDVSQEGPIAHTTGDLLSSDDRPTSTTIESKSEVIPESRPPALVGDILATSTIVDITNDSGLSSSPNEGDSKKSPLVKNRDGLSSSPKEGDSKKSSWVKDSDEDKSAEVRAPLEVLEKPDSKCKPSYEADFASSGRSLDETNSFTNAESEFSQRSDFAASSHKLSDSLEIFEDAPDSLDACSVGGSVEESESLDEPRQVGDGAQEDSKLLGRASLDEKVAGVQNPNVMKGASDEPEQKPILMNAGEASSEEKATTMSAGSSAMLSKMDELKAPSPEAWQEPGPSTSVKEGKKIVISEVTEDGKSSESHTALRNLMSMEGKDKMDEAVASPVVVTDPQNSGQQEASANGKKPKSRLKSFWSHCICCPAVH